MYTQLTFSCELKTQTVLFGVMKTENKTVVIVI